MIALASPLNTDSKRTIREVYAQLLTAADPNTIRLKSLSPRIRMGCPLAISCSALRCFELFSCPFSLLKSSSPTTSRVVCFVTPSSTRQPAAAAALAASRRGTDSVPVNTRTSPNSSPSGLPSLLYPWAAVRSMGCFTRVSHCSTSRSALS